LPVQQVSYGPLIMSILLIMSCYTGCFNVRRGWQSLNAGTRFYLRLIRRTGWLWIFTSRTTANQQNVTLYMLNMTINTVGTLNLSTEFGALFGFFLHLLRRLIFFLKKCVLRSPCILHVECKGFEVVYVLHHLYIMYSNVKTLSDVT
jgi:hypothetical protein